MEGDSYRNGKNNILPVSQSLVLPAIFVKM
jgi:hypothetical protein